MPENNFMAPLRTELAAARQDLDKVDATFERAGERAERGDRRGAGDQLAAANALLHDARRIINMLIRDAEQAARPLRNNTRKRVPEPERVAA